MKGMLDFLEKAGLVTREEPAPEAEIELSIRDVAAPAADVASPAPGQPASPTAVAEPGVPLDLQQIYANAGITPALYPAERLLRLVDGLATMDPATRLMAIQAMDAADESWTIADPLNDAAAKVAALSAHDQQLQSELQQIELQTQRTLDAVAARQEQVVGDIRKQIAELEGLVERELARAALETATHQASLQGAREQTARLLAGTAQASARLQHLAVQLSAANPAKE